MVGWPQEASTFGPYIVAPIRQPIKELLPVTKRINGADRFVKARMNTTPPAEGIDGSWHPPEVIRENEGEA